MKNLKEAKRNTYDLIVVDGNNIAFKYKKDPFNSFTNKAGIKTGVIYGIMRLFLLSLQKEYCKSTTKIIFCWDDEGCSELRKSKVSSYKGNRDHSGDGELFRQIKEVASILPAYGYQSIAGKYEADDAAFTIVNIVKEKLGTMGKTLLVSEDHDWEQLVCNTVHLWKHRSKQLITTKLSYSYEVYASLMGDASDNIHSSRICNDEEAKMLASKYDTVNDLLKGKPDPKFAKKILEHLSELQQNASLVKLYHIKEIENQLKSFVRGKIDSESIINFVNKWEFSKPDIYVS